MTADQLVSTQLTNVPRNRIWITNGDLYAGWLYQSRETDRMKRREVVDVNARLVNGEIVYGVVVK